MSLHDVDKSSLNRSSPIPNHGDRLPAEVRMSHGTFGVSLVNEETGEPVAKLIIKDGRFQLISNGAVSVDGGDGTIDLIAADGNTNIQMGTGKIDVKKNNGDVIARLGDRSSDSQGAVEIAKPGDTI